MLPDDLELVHRLDRLVHHRGHCTKRLAIWCDMALHRAEQFQMGVEDGFMSREDL